GVPLVLGPHGVPGGAATPRRSISRPDSGKAPPGLSGGVIALQALVRALRFGPPPTACGYAGQLLATVGWSSLPYLWRLRTPTLVITGDCDPIVPVVNARILASVIPDARLRVLQGAGHLFLIMQAEETADLVQEFLAGQERARH